MNKLLTLLLFTTLLFSCSSDEGDNLDKTHNYTSFVLVCESSSRTIKNAIIGYRADDNKWVRVAALGDIIGKTESKETKVNFSINKELTLFFDVYNNEVYQKTVATDFTYKLSENKKNVFVIPYMFTTHDVNKEKADQYPM